MARNLMRLLLVSRLQDWVTLGCGQGRGNSSLFTPSNRGYVESISLGKKNDGVGKV
jgi:hypothetical protein